MKFSTARPETHTTPWGTCRECWPVVRQLQYRVFFAICQLTYHGPAKRLAGMPLIVFCGNALYLLAKQPLPPLKFLRSTDQIRRFGIWVKRHEILMVQEFETLLFGHLTMPARYVP